MQIHSTKNIQSNYSIKKNYCLNGRIALLSCANHRTTVLQRGPQMRYKLQSLDNEILITILKYEEHIQRNQSETRK